MSNHNTISPIPRPEILNGYTQKFNIGCGNLYVTINKDEHNNILEIIIKPGKDGGCQSNVEALARMASLALRAGVKIDAIIDQLVGIRCLSCIRRDGVKVLSCSDAVGRALKSINSEK